MTSDTPAPLTPEELAQAKDRAQAADCCGCKAHAPHESVLLCLHELAIYQHDDTGRLVASVEAERALREAAERDRDALAAEVWRLREAADAVLAERDLDALARNPARDMPGAQFDALHDAAVERRRAAFRALAQPAPSPQVSAPPSLSAAIEAVDKLALDEGLDLATLERAKVALRTLAVSAPPPSAPEGDGTIVVPFNPCLAKLRPGEPFFVLLGRDVDAETAVRVWVESRTYRRGASDKTRSALALADAMRAYREAPPLPNPAQPTPVEAAAAEEWVTDREPTEDDADEQGLVRVWPALPAHWAYPAPGQRWQHTPAWHAARAAV